MAVSKIRDKVRPFLEGLCTALLFGMQTIVYAGVFISIMALPLLSYVYFYITDINARHALSFELYVLLFSNYIIVGRIIALVGAGIFLVAACQWVWYRYKQGGLFKKGLYARLRHPQFTGIIIFTLGLTITVATNGEPLLLYPFVKQDILPGNILTPIIGLWLLQVMGYVIIAWFEDRSLSKKFGAEYKDYKAKVPFLFPVKNPSKIPELLFTILIVFVICIVLWFLPYEFISINIAKLIPNPPSPWL